MIYTVTFNPSRDVTLILPEPLAAGGIFRAEPPIVRAGGKGNNVARVAKALGADVTAVGFYGGVAGHGVLLELERLGIPVLIESAAGETRTCLTILDRNGDITEIREPGPPVDRSRAESLLARLLERVGPKDWVTLSGSLPPGQSPETWAVWVGAIAPQVAGVVVDTAGPGLLSAIEAGATFATPNREEWRDLRPGPEVRPRVIVTEGAAGAVYCAEDGVERRWRPPPVPVVNSVGAGDAFLGGLVWRLAGGDRLLDAIGWAVATGAASCLTPGVGDVDPTEVAARHTEVTVEPPLPNR